MIHNQIPIIFGKKERIQDQRDFSSYIDIKLASNSIHNQNIMNHNNG